MRGPTNLSSDLDYQRRILPAVSRTFALTIPQLPAPLRDVVANAYLLCRIADTIEDDGALDYATKARFLSRFIDVLKQKRDPHEFAAETASALSSETPQSERELVTATATVVRITYSFSPTQRAALERCVETMCGGMPGFQRGKSLDGLSRLEDLDRYCYYAAGVVGEMLTELFCDYSDEIAENREAMMSLAVSFGQGLQMTNILKDIWQDSRSNTCWLPADYFENIEGGLSRALHRRDGDAVSGGINELVGVAHRHLVDALEYSCTIPRRESGIRRFCLWAIGLAVLTLRKIYMNPGYTDGIEVKVSRRTVKATILACNIAQSSDRVLKRLFALSARGLPLADIEPGTDTERSSDKAQPCIEVEAANRAPAQLS